MPLNDYETVPVGSLLTQDRDIEIKYIKRLPTLPSNLLEIVMSERTGAYVRGLVRTHHLNDKQASIIAFAILRIIFGDQTLAQLGSILSTELKISNDKAQSIAQDIEKELFAPIMLEYNQSLRSKKASAAPVLRPSAGAQNVLDLKQQQANRPLQPPPATPRPVAPLRSATPTPIPRPPTPKSVFPPPPSSSSSRPPNVPW